MDTTGCSSQTGSQDGCGSGISCSRKMAENDNKRTREHRTKFRGAGSNKSIDHCILGGISSRESRSGNALSQSLWPPGMVNSDGMIVMEVLATDSVSCKSIDDTIQRRANGILNNILNKQPTSWSIPSTVLQENTPPGNSNKRPRVVSLVTMLVAVTFKPTMAWTLVPLVTITHLMLSLVPTTTETVDSKNLVPLYTILHCRNKNLLFKSFIVFCKRLSIDPELNDEVWQNISLFLSLCLPWSTRFTSYAAEQVKT